MKIKRNHNSESKVSISESRIRTILIYVIPLTVLSVSPFLTFDPINLVKQMVISIFTFSAFALALTSRPFLRISRLEKFVFTIVSLGLLVPLLFTNSPISLQVWGIFGRSNGFLSYFCLFMLSFLTMRYANANHFSRLEKSLLITLVIEIVYGIFQWAGFDPVKWSHFDVFGTLGNVNFMSSFLGMGLLIPLYRIWDARLKLRVLFPQGAILIAGVLLLIKTHSFQGIAVLVLEIAIFVLFRILFRRKFFLLGSYLILISIAVVLGALGLANKGPLSKWLFQETNVFRVDYMGAAWRTFLSSPLTGVGHDSFDGWYRKFRGFISAYRTTPNRTTNSAHNIFLDIAANCGFLLLLGYVLLICIAVVRSVRGLLQNNRMSVKTQNSFEVLFVIWCGYLLQSLFSINQIGIGVIGWSLLGIGLNSNRIKENSSQKSSSKKSVTPNLPAAKVLIGVVGALVGGLIALPPVVADNKYKSAFQSGNLNKLIDVSHNPTATAFELSNIVSAGIKSGYGEQVLPVTRLLVSKFPRDIYGWNALLISANSTAGEKELAGRKIKEIDPFYACFEADPGQFLYKKFLELSVEKKVELLRWWNLLPRTESGAADSSLISGVPASAIIEKLGSTCRQ